MLWIGEFAREGALMATVAVVAGRTTAGNFRPKLFSDSSENRFAQVQVQGLHLTECRDTMEIRRVFILCLIRNNKALGYFAYYVLLLLLCVP